MAIVNDRTVDRVANDHRHVEIHQAWNAGEGPCRLLRDRLHRLSVVKTIGPAV